jgi:hypothetical protein
MKCSSRDQPVEDDWVACPRCGMALVCNCGTCGKRLEADWKHYPSCGCAADESIHKITEALGHVSKDVPRSIIPTARCTVIFQQSRAAYRPDAAEAEEARLILQPGAPAVLGLNGDMLEPACHGEWAVRLLARNASYRLWDLYPQPADSTC